MTAGPMNFEWCCPAGRLRGSMSNASANTLLQRTAGPRLRGQTASLFMLAIRGGRSVGDIATGLSVSALRIRWALFLNGVLAVLIQFSLARAWEAHAESSISSPTSAPGETAGAYAVHCRGGRHAIVQPLPSQTDGAKG